MFKQLTRNLHYLVLGDKNDTSDQACREKSEMLFKILPMCDQSTRLNIDLPKIWISKKFSFSQNQGNFFENESFLFKNHDRFEDE